MFGKRRRWQKQSTGRPTAYAGGLIFWILFGLLFLLIFNQDPKIQEYTYTDFRALLEKGEVQEATIQGDQLEGQDKEGKKFTVYLPPDTQITDELIERKVRVTAKPEGYPWYIAMLVNWGPMFILIFIWLALMRRMSGGMMGGFQKFLGKGGARQFEKSESSKTFRDVAGADEAKEELQEVVEFLKDPARFTKLGGRMPKGCLLVGPPGTGKTLLARAVAGEAGVPFFSISGSDFVEMFVGVGASRVRDLFDQGRENAPCIIFIDELDAVGRQRGAGLGGGHDEREQTLNQLLVQMDGFEAERGIIILAATNRPDVLDPALLRPGRFDRRVVVDRPDVRGREAILKIHVRGIPFADDVDISLLARGTPGFVGADLENMVNEAALLAARRDRDAVSMYDFEQAKDKVIMGSERKSMVMGEEERRIVAYHESGHALVAKFLPDADPVHKISIIPRGMALGATLQLPVDDRHLHSREYLLARITILMGGRVAEELVFGKITTGAADDLKKASEIARRMVCEWGMSGLGPLTFGQEVGEVFLGREFSRKQNYSDSVAARIDSEVREIIDRQHRAAKEILSGHCEVLERLASRLLQRETLEAHEIDDLL